MHSFALLTQEIMQSFARFNLSDDYTGMTAMIFGELYRSDGEWKFNAIGQGTTDSGLKELLARFHD